MSDIELTVLLASHNGDRWIERVLDGYLAQEAPFRWRLVVVDNASSDGTRDILRRYETRLPLIVVGEPRLGKNRALNTGLGQVEGDLVVLTDDDAVPHPGFLLGWRSLLGRFLDYDLFGGKVEALFEVEPPAWVRKLARMSPAAFAQRDLQTGSVAAEEIFGPNMCVRRRVFDAGMRFNENIGPSAGDPNYPMGSETDFCRRAAAAGYQSMFLADVSVSHIVRANQTTMAYFKTVALRAGRRDALLHWEQGGGDSIKRQSSWRGLAPLWLKSAILRGMALASIGNVARNQRWWRYYWFRGYHSWAAKLADDTRD